MSYQREKLPHAGAAERQALRVAIVTETYPPEINGVAMTMGRLVEGLRTHGHNVQLIRPRQHAEDHPQAGEAYEEVLVRGLPIPRYPELKLGLPAATLLHELWSRKRPDVVHLVTEGPLGWSALRTARRLGLPVVSDFHTNFHQYSRHYGFGWLRRPIAAYLRHFHNLCDATLVPTHVLRDDLVRQGFRSVDVVSRGVDTALFNPRQRSRSLRERWGVGESDPVAIHVGRIAPEKNLPLVLQAYAAIKAAAPRARLVLVGDGPTRPSIEARHSDFIFAGMRTGQDLAVHYASADIFLFPSLTETFGNVTTEAMASGLGVVAFDYAAARQLIVDGYNGRVAAPGNAGAFISAAVSLAAAPDHLDHLRRRAHESMRRVDWAFIVDEFVRLLAAAAHGAPTKAGAANEILAAPN